MTDAAGRPCRSSGTTRCAAIQDTSSTLLVRADRRGHAGASPAASALLVALQPAGHRPGDRPGRAGAPVSPAATTTTAITTRRAAGAAAPGRATSTPCASRSPPIWPRSRRPGARSRRPTSGWSSRPPSCPVQPRPGAVRLRRLARPAGAAAQGGQLLPAAAAPLRRASSTSGPTSTSPSRSTAPQRMQRLINDLLAFSRIGRLTTGFTEVDLDQWSPRWSASSTPARADRRRGHLVRPAGGARRGAAAGHAVREPDRQRAEVPPPRRAAAGADLGAARRRRVGDQLRGQRHRHRAASSPTRSS